MKRSYPVNLLIVASSEVLADALAACLRDARLTLRPHLAVNTAAFSSALAGRVFDLVLACPGVEGLAPQRVAERLRELHRDAVVIAIDETGSDRGGEPPPPGVADRVPARPGAALVHAAQRELRHLRERRALIASRRLVEQTQRVLLELMEASGEAIVFVIQGAIVSANPAFKALFGYPPSAELRGVPLGECVAEVERDALRTALADALGDEAAVVVLELEGRRADGTAMALRLELSPMVLDRQRGLRITASGEPIDGTQAREAAPARHDAVAGLLESKESLLSAIAERATAPEGGNLVYLELEDHPALRARCGLAGAELVVHEAAGRLKSALPDGAVAARVADDAFAVLVPARAPARRAASSMAAAIAGGAYRAGTQSILVGCRAGSVDLDRAQGMALLDLAFSEARRFEAQPTLSDSTGDVTAPGGGPASLDVAGELRGAESDGRLSLAFQPIVRLHGEPMELYEVFLRLRARDGTAIPPADFIPVAEREGLIVPVSEWLIERVCTVLHDRHRAGHATHLFLKLSSHAMGELAVPIGIRRQLARSGVPPQRLIVEISEAAASTDLRSAAAFLKSLRQFGCGTAIEHFGVSFRSFELLNHLPADYVKIDGALVEGLASDAAARERVAAIAREVRDGGRHSIAENLEDPAALAALFQCGVEFAQGYYIQEPTESLDFTFDIELA